MSVVKSKIFSSTDKSGKVLRRMQLGKGRAKNISYGGIKCVVMALLLNVISISPAHAEFPQTLVIADTAIDSSMAEFSNNIVHELCILDWPVRVQLSYR
jgi:hypothetical protein